MLATDYYKLAQEFGHEPVPLLRYLALQPQDFDHTHGDEVGRPRPLSAGDCVVMMGEMGLGKTFVQTKFAAETPTPPFSTLPAARFCPARRHSALFPPASPACSATSTSPATSCPPTKTCASSTSLDVTNRSHFSFVAVDELGTVLDQSLSGKTDRHNAVSNAGVFSVALCNAWTLFAADALLDRSSVETLCLLLGKGDMAAGRARLYVERYLHNPFPHDYTVFLNRNFCSELCPCAGRLVLCPFFSFDSRIRPGLSFPPKWPSDELE